MIGIIFDIVAAWFSSGVETKSDLWKLFWAKILLLIHFFGSYSKFSIFFDLQDGAKYHSESIFIGFSKTNHFWYRHNLKRESSYSIYFFLTWRSKNWLTILEQNSTRFESQWRFVLNCMRKQLAILKTLPNIELS